MSKAPELVSEHGKGQATLVKPKPKPKPKPVPPKPPHPPKPPAPPTAGELRERIVEFWLWGIAHEPQIHYAQGRPMERLLTPKLLKVLPRTCDCSEFFTDGYAYADAHDPNGEHYNGTGFTGTLISNGHEIPLGEAQPGDAVIFGPGNGEHVCGLLVPGDDPWLVSHGQEKGPLKVRLSIEREFHNAPARFFRYLPH